MYALVLFCTGPRDASWMIGHVDIHAVTGLLKMYLRELPESLFTNDMYQKYLEARGLQFDYRYKTFELILFSFIAT